MFTAIYKLFNYFIETYIPEVKHFSLYSANYINETNNNVIRYPAVFIEILPAIANQYAGEAQYFNITVNLHIVSEMYTSFDSNDKMLDNSLAHLNVLNDIYYNLDGFSDMTLPDELKVDGIRIDQMKRSSVNLGIDFGRRRSSVVSFEFRLLDATKLPKVKTYIKLPTVDNFKVV